MKAPRARCSAVIWVITDLLAAPIVRLALTRPYAGRLRQESLEQRFRDASSRRPRPPRRCAGETDRESDPPSPDTRQYDPASTGVGKSWLACALGGVKLLILDDWGLEPLGPEQRHDMLEIVEDRYGRGATLITSQIPVDRWHDLIEVPTLADAILDRIIHNAHRL